MDEFMESRDHGALTVVCGENARKIKRKKGKSKSKERPPKVLSIFSHLEKQLVALYLRDFSAGERCAQRLHLIIRTFEEDFRRASGAISSALNVEVAGGLMMGLGLVLAPVHRGISALITGAGLAVFSGAAVGDKVWSEKIVSLQNRLIQDTEAEMRRFQIIISPMMDTMNEISRHVHEILQDLSYPERDVGYLNKYFSSASELVRFIQIYDISVLATQIRSQTSFLIRVNFMGALPFKMALELTWMDMVRLQDCMEEMTKLIERIADQPD